MEIPLGTAKSFRFKVKVTFAFLTQYTVLYESGWITYTILCASPIPHPDFINPLDILDMSPTPFEAKLFKDTVPIFEPTSGCPLHQIGLVQSESSANYDDLYVDPICSLINKESLGTMRLAVTRTTPGKFKCYLVGMLDSQIKARIVVDILICGKEKIQTIDTSRKIIIE